MHPIDKTFITLQMDFQPETEEECFEILELLDEKKEAQVMGTYSYEPALAFLQCECGFIGNLAEYKKTNCSDFE